jgi:hypothetical protein
MVALGVVFRRRRLRRANRIGRRKTAYQAGFKLGVEVAVRRGGLARIGGMPVMRRGIELLSHEILRFEVNGDMIGKFLSSATAALEKLVPTDETLPETAQQNRPNRSGVPRSAEVREDSIQAKPLAAFDWLPVSAIASTVRTISIGIFRC